jgi:hypothetical protein
MLFALNARGTPSVSTTISISNTATQPPADSYGQAVYNDSPSVYWPLDDPTGPTAADASGNGDTGNSVGGVIFGSPSPVEGSTGTGVTLDGSSGQIVASQAITDPTTYSEQMWFSTTSDRGGFLMGFGSSPSGLSSDQDRQVWMSDNGQLNFGVYTGKMVTIRSTGTYNDGNWHDVVATQGPDGMSLYVDGQLVGSNSTNQAASYVGYWRVGADDLSGWPNQPTSNYFGGEVSDVAFYDVELSANQAEAQFQASPAG